VGKIETLKQAACSCNRQVECLDKIADAAGCSQPKSGGAAELRAPRRPCSPKRPDAGCCARPRRHCAGGEDLGGAMEEVLGGERGLSEGERERRKDKVPRVRGTNVIHMMSMPLLTILR